MSSVLSPLRNAWQTPNTSSSAASGRRLIFAMLIPSLRRIRSDARARMPVSARNSSTRYGTERCVPHTSIYLRAVNGISSQLGMLHGRRQTGGRGELPPTGPGEAPEGSRGHPSWRAVGDAGSVDVDRTLADLPRAL